MGWFIRLRPEQHDLLLQRPPLVKRFVISKPEYRVYHRHLCTCLVSRCLIFESGQETVVGQLPLVDKTRIAERGTCEDEEEGMQKVR